MLRRQLTEDPFLRRVIFLDIDEGYVRRDDWLIGKRPGVQNLDYNAEIREVKTRGLVQVLKRSNCCEHQRRLLVSSLVVVALTKKGGCSKTDQATTEKTINSWDSVNQSLIKNKIHQQTVQRSIVHLTILLLIFFCYSTRCSAI